MPASNTYLVEDKTPTMVAQYLADVEFGVPSQKCKNFGICAIVSSICDQPIQLSSNRKSRAIVTVFGQNHVELDFLRASLNDHTFASFFASDKFLVEEDFKGETPIPSNFSFSILAGEYTILDNSAMLKVVFN